MKTFEKFRQHCLQENYPIMSQEVLEEILHNLNQRKQASVLELGSCVGYSAIVLASNSNTTIVSIERDMERHILAKENVKKFGLEPLIKMVYDDALTFETTDTYDFIIFDAAKAQNQAFLDRYLPHLNNEGVIFIDNVDFHGLTSNVDSITGKNLRSMVRKLKNFEENLLLRQDLDVTYKSVGDGLLIIRKKRLNGK